jgi:hypothetical protein
MTLQPFFRYYGAKCKFAHLYPAPQYQTIVEPFAGTAGYSLRYPRLQVILFDKSEVVTTLWDYLIRVKETEIRSLPTDVLHVELDDLRLCQEARWLIGMWVTLSPQTPAKRASVYVRNNYHPGRNWSRRVRERIASQLKFIRHWKVFHQSYRKAPDIIATWFVDPPYNNKAGSCYKHHKINYPSLGQWCLERQGQVIVCENEGADWLPFVTLKSTKALSKVRGKTTGFSKEVVYHRCDKKTGFDKVRRT